MSGILGEEFSTDMVVSGETVYAAEVEARLTEDGYPVSGDAVSAALAEREYRNYVRELYEKNPEEVMSVYKVLYEGTYSWETETGDYRFESCLIMDSEDMPESWAFQR